MLPMKIKSISLLYEETQKIWLMELSLEMHGHIVVLELGEDELLDLIIRLMILIGDISDIDVEHLVKVVSDIDRVDGVRPGNGTGRVSIHLRR